MAFPLVRQPESCSVLSSPGIHLLAQGKSQGATFFLFLTTALKTLGQACYGDASLASFLQH